MNDLIEREAAVEAVFRQICGFWHPNASRAARQVAEAALRDVPASTRYTELERTAKKLLATATVSGPEHFEARADVCVAALCDLKVALANLDQSTPDLASKKEEPDGRLS